MDKQKHEDYDAAVRISQEIEKDVADMGTWVSPLNIEILLVNMFMGCIYPIVWLVVVFFYVAAGIAAAKRSSTRACLKNHDVEGAKAACSSAKTWHRLCNAALAAMAIIEFWGIFQLLKFFKGAGA